MDYELIFLMAAIWRVLYAVTPEQTYSVIDRVPRARCLLSMMKRTWTRTTRIPVSVVATVNVLSRFSTHDIDMAKCSILSPDDDEVVLSGEHSFRYPIICTIAICFLYESLRAFRYLYIYTYRRTSAK